MRKTCVVEEPKEIISTHTLLKLTLGGVQTVVLVWNIYLYVFICVCLFPPFHITEAEQRLSTSIHPVSSRKLPWWKAIAGVKHFFSTSLQLVEINRSQPKTSRRRGREGERGLGGGCDIRLFGCATTGNMAFSYLPYTIKALLWATVSQVQLCFSTRSVNCCQYSDSLHLPIMTGSRLPILSAGQVAPHLGGITAAIKSVWANRKALVCLWGVNGERHWRQEVLRKWKALYCTPEWPGIGFLSNPMGKPHYRSLHRVITTGRWSSSDPLHLNDNITSLHSFFPLVWPDDDPCGTSFAVTGVMCWSYSTEKVRFGSFKL